MTKKVKNKIHCGLRRPLMNKSNTTINKKHAGATKEGQEINRHGAWGGRTQTRVQMRLHPPNYFVWYVGTDAVCTRQKNGLSVCSLWYVNCKKLKCFFSLLLPLKARAPPWCFPPILQSCITQVLLPLLQFPCAVKLQWSH
jgi:hypothetical protein